MYVAPADRDSNVGSYVVHPCKGKEWRGVLKEWLNLLVLMRNPKSLYRSQFLKEVLIKRLVRPVKHIHGI